MDPRPASRKLLLMCAVLVVHAAGAQEDAVTPRTLPKPKGVKFILPQWDKVYADDGIPSVSMGIGFSKHIAKRLAYGFELTFVVRTLSSDDYDFATIRYKGVTTRQGTTRSGLSFVYNTAYFLTDPNHFAPYIGTTLGLFKVAREMRVEEPYEPDPDLWKRRYEESATLFPIGLRFGLRSPMNGAYVDLYGGVGYLIGGDKDLFEQPELAGAGGHIDKLTWSISIAVGASFDR
jgi:hypothetical protein